VTIVQVALDVPLARTFDYLAGDATSADIGRLVLVPFGPNRRVGIIVGLSHASEVKPERLRPVVRIVRSRPPMPAQILDLCLFCSRYYHHPLGEVLLGAIPTALRRAQGTALSTPVVFRLTAAGAAQAPDGLPRASVARRALLDRLRAAGALADHDIRGAGARRALRSLVAAGWVSSSDQPAHEPGREEPASRAQPGPALTTGQAAAVDTVLAALGGFQTILLQGITGSGKTEVYLRILEAVLAGGGQALLLVPEINLTPQLEAQLAERFGSGRLVTLHSALAEGERLVRWDRAAAGQVGIVAGTRLAVFTPLPRLAAVIVDEEHDASYKQQEGLRYHARDLAVFLGRQRGVPVILGSATPSLESFRQAEAGRYRRLTLDTRASGRPPAVRIVDTHGVNLDNGLSPMLLQALADNLARAEQSLVFLNRRGFAPTLLCPACGWVAPCQRCSARLTVHAPGRRLRCHLCGHHEAVPRVCPACGSQDLRALGEGTQRLEQALAARLPAARVARIDRDATRRRGAFRALRERIDANQLDVLVGTQMLAKGHDFPNLTLVCVLGADLGLMAADFRAEERLFALLLQVAGRAGRGDRPGQVLVQTAFPGHPLFAALQAQDYDGFARGQLSVRQASGFPPFLYQALLRAEAAEEHAVFDFLREAARCTGPLPEEIVVYDPVPANPARVAGRWRGQLLLQSTARPPLHRLLDAWLPRLPEQRVHWSIDVDPLEV
jgi:primosomal protein N' (replication factor Y)